MSHFTPRPYQLESMRFLINKPHAGLFLDMGLGKTAISLAVMETLKKKGKIRVLLIAPIRVLYTVWPEEIKKWGFDLTYINLHKAGREALYTADVDIYGINPESSLVMLQDSRFQGQVFDLLVVDESSLYKSYSSRRFKLLQKHLHRFGKRWILTGTPAPNGLIDIWSQIYIIDRGAALGEYITRFRNAFCMPDWNGYDYVLVAGAEKEIYRRIQKYVLRMDSKDYLDMPELIHNRVPVILTPAVRKMYKEMEHTFLLRLEQDVVMSPNAAAAGMRCRQIANGGIYLPNGTPQHLHDIKTEALVELVEELQGRQVVVFYEFLHDKERIRAAIGGGFDATPDNINKFNAGKIQVLLGHPASMGYGVNLQERCDTVIWYGIPWDLGAYDQAIARIWRSGQKSDRVIVHHIVAEDTLDEVVLDTLQLKARDQRKLLDAMKRRK